METLSRVWNYRPDPARYGSLRVRALRGLAFLLALMVCLTIVSRAADAMTIAEVGVGKPTRAALVHTLEVDGNVEAVDRIPLLLPSGVQVSELLVAEGDRVEQGDLLLVCDSTELQRELSQKRLELQRLQLEQEELEAQRERELEDAGQAVERAGEDFEIAVRRAEANVQAAVDQRQAAQRALRNYDGGDDDDNGETQAQLREALLQALQALQDAEPGEEPALQARQLAIDIQLKQMDITWLQQSADQSGEVHAPLGGVVGELRVVAGQSTTGEAALYLTGTAGLRLVAEIDGEQKKLLDVDATVTVDIPGGGDITRLAVTSVQPVDGETDRFRAVIDLPEDSGLSLYGSATIKVAKRSETYPTCVPLAALYQDSGNSYYLLALGEGESVLGSEQVVRRVDVQVLERGEELAAVNGALGDDDRIVVSAARALQDGDRVRLAG